MVMATVNPVEEVQLPLTSSYSVCRSALVVREVM
jgi:hypothetical protein